MKYLLFTKRKEKYKQNNKKITLFPMSPQVMVRNTSWIVSSKILQQGKKSLLKKDKLYTGYATCQICYVRVHNLHIGVAAN